MGNAYNSPNFKDLIESIMYLVMHQYTSTFTSESTKKPPLPEPYEIIDELDE
jgi:hypothetical protein